MARGARTRAVACRGRAGGARRACEASIGFLHDQLELEAISPRQRSRVSRLAA
jgi:hypothetical protein